ncbi:unnamed protein product [Paramecium sonneborni]|uniref:Uncharacterized protein n=1 Tax=Paramecium sonneborni TaxID=65129 RepID=A0A8S1RPZ9_9CILI|nr:unnamed protein product [Paramecium sonneborni]
MIEKNFNPKIKLLIQSLVLKCSNTKIQYTLLFHKLQHQPQSPSLEIIRLIKIKQMLNHKFNNPSPLNHKLSPCSYKLISSFYLKLSSHLVLNQSPKFQAFVFNNDSSILGTGQSGGSIKGFKFKERAFKLSLFLYVGDDKYIIIWSVNKSQMRRSTNRIQCLIMNNQEYFIISGSSDNTIKFQVQELIMEMQLDIIQQYLQYQMFIIEHIIKLVNIRWQVVRINYHQQSHQTIIKDGKQSKRYQFKSMDLVYDQMLSFKPETFNMVHIYDIRKQILLNKNGKNVNLIRLH